MTNQIDGKAVERLAARLEGTPTYDGSGEICDMPEFAATMLRALLSERDALQAQVEGLTKERDRINSALGDTIKKWSKSQDAQIDAMERAEKAEAALAREGAAAMEVRELAALTLDNHGDGAVNEALGQRICCNGQMCGCQGSDVGSFLQWLIRSIDLPTAPADALARREDEAIERCAKWVDKRLSDYIQECGTYDPSTGQTEFPDGGEYASELEDIADGLRALKRSAKEAT